MKCYARVDGGPVVLETTNIPDDMGNILPADLGLPGTWVVCPEGTYGGMIYTAKGNKFSAPPPAPFTQADRDRAYLVAVDYANGFTRQITDKYPEGERASWPQRLAEALDILAGKPLSEASILTSLSQATGIALPDLAKSVIAKAKAYNVIVTAVEIIRTKAQAALANCNSHDEVSAALAALRTEANAQAKALGLVVPS